MILASNEAPLVVFCLPLAPVFAEETAIRNANAQTKTPHPLTSGMPVDGCL